MTKKLTLTKQWKWTFASSIGIYIISLFLVAADIDHGKLLYGHQAFVGTISLIARGIDYLDFGRTEQLWSGIYYNLTNVIMLLLAVIHLFKSKRWFLFFCGIAFVPMFTWLTWIGPKVGYFLWCLANIGIAISIYLKFKLQKAER